MHAAKRVIQQQADYIDRLRADRMERADYIDQLLAAGNALHAWITVNATTAQQGPSLDNLLDSWLEARHG